MAHTSGVGDRNSSFGNCHNQIEEVYPRLHLRLTHFNDGDSEGKTFGANFLSDFDIRAYNIFHIHSDDVSHLSGYPVDGPSTYMRRISCQSTCGHWPW